MGALALLFIVLGFLLVGFTWHRAEHLGDDYDQMADMSRCIIGGYLSILIGVALGFLAGLS